MKTKTAYFNYLINGISLTSQDAANCSHSGQCDSDVLLAMKKPYIKKQLDALPVDKLALELREYGAWDEIQLQDHNANLMRILWLAAGDIQDGK